MLEDRVRIERRLKRRGRLDPGEAERLLGQARRSAHRREKFRATRPTPTYPPALPISDRKDEILAAIRAHPVVVVVGETGSGKSTQLPKICLEAGRGEAGRVAVTQPRRVAALSIAQRVAEELKVTYGRDVGCKIRFRDQTAPETCIKVMTDGILLAETQTDPDLLEYDTIIVDEAHERSLNIDFLLGYLRLLRRKRPDLKIVITSATIDAETFARAFDDAPVIEVSGRMFPVEVRYWPLDELLQDRGDYTYLDAAASAVEEIVRTSRQGDLLVFLPSERDIRETRERLEGRKLRGVEILPLFGRLTAGEQQRVFAPGGPPARSVGHQYRRDFPDHSPHPLRRRYRLGAPVALQSPHPHPAPADRTHCAEQCPPTGGALRAGCGRSVHSPLLGAGLSLAPRIHPARDPTRQSRRGHPADD